MVFVFYMRHSRRLHRFTKLLTFYPTYSSFCKKINNMEVILSLNHVPSRVMVWGDALSEEKSDVILFICGNPGIPDFYEEFSLHLQKATNLPVCVVGHAGQETLTNYKNVSDNMYDQKHLCNLPGQVDHKIDLIKNNLIRKGKVHLIGHSIGAWMILELLHKEPSILGNVSTVTLLYPVLQKIKETRNGIMFKQANKKRVLNFIKILYLLPERVIRAIIWMFVKYKKWPILYITALLKLAHPKTAAKVLALGDEELDTVTNLNVEVLNKIKQLTNVIHGANDGWAPLEYIDDLRQFEPYIQLKQVNESHAFVFDSSETIALTVSEFINKMKENKISLS